MSKVKTSIQDRIATVLWDELLYLSRMFTRSDADDVAEAIVRTFALDRLEWARKAFVNLTEAWAELRMDTETQQALHDRLVSLSRTAAAEAARFTDSEN